MVKERRLGCLKGCFSFVLLMIIAITVVTGLIIHKLKSDDHNINIVWDDQDYESGIKKAKTQVNGDIAELNLLTVYYGAYKTEGTVNINDKFSEKEINAILNKANSTGPVKDINIKFRSNNRFEFKCRPDSSIMPIMNKHLGLSEIDNAFAVKWISRIINNKPIYGNGYVEIISENHIRLHMDYAKIGNIAIKGDSLLKLRLELESLINSILAKKNGIVIKNLNIDEGSLDFSGSLPAKISTNK